MKLSCEVIRDLMVLYDEDVCSEESRKLVEAHLEECAECRRYLEELGLAEKLLKEEEQEEEPSGEELLKEEQILKKSFRKIRHRWAASLIAVLLILPVLGLGILTIHECTGWGMAFSNLDEILVIRSFLKKLERGKYEQAAEMIDYAVAYQSIMDAYKWYKTDQDRKEYEAFFGEVLVMTQEEYVEYRKKLFVEDMTSYASGGANFQFGFSDAYRYEDGHWDVEFAVKEQYADGNSGIYYIEFAEENGKVRHTSGRAPEGIHEREDSLGYVFGIAHP